MKVVMLGFYSPEKQIGGIQVHIHELVHHLSQINGLELHLITFGDKKKRIIKGNLNIHSLKRWLPGYFYLPFEIITLIYMILKINPDVVHAHESCMPFSTAAAILHKKYPLVLTMHMFLKEWEYSDNKIDQLNKLITSGNEKYVLSVIPHIIAVSSYLRNRIIEVSKSNVYIIPNGVDITYSQSFNALNSERFILFSVGMLEKWKGFDVLLQAVFNVKSVIPNIILYVAGKGEEEAALIKIVEDLGLENYVKFLGFISEDKHLYYNSADVFILPSRNESFGIVLLEAMACGTPVIASNVGGIPDIVKHGKNGLLFESENVDDLTRKIILLLKDKTLRHEMSMKGLETAKSFSWEKVAMETFNVYRKILCIK